MLSEKILGLFINDMISRRMWDVRNESSDLELELGVGRSYALKEIEMTWSLNHS